MILATLQQIVYSLQEKLQGGGGGGGEGGGGGYTECLKQLPRKQRFLSWMAQFSVYEVSHERISKR